ncbi:MAG: EAL domain-containing protein [Burkholderiaceae bacterium]|nr:EAL domain-containing protein [Burkholderiaceae bacterium]
MFLNRLSIGARLAAVLTTIMVACLVGNIVAARQFLSARESARAVLEKRAKSARLVTDWYACIYASGIRAALVARTGDMEVVRHLESSRRETTNSVSEIQTKVSSQIDGSREKEMFDVVTRDRKTYLDLVDKIYLFKKNDESAKAIALFENQFARASDQYLHALHALMNEEQRELDSSASQSQEMQDRAIFYLAVSSTLALALGIFLTVYLVKSITKPLALVQRVAREIATMDLHGKPHERYQTDEAGSLLKSLDEMRESLTAVLESSTDGILVTDLSGRIRSFNRRFASIWDIPEEIMLSERDKSIQEWMAGMVSDPAAYLKNLEALLSTPIVQGQDSVNLQNGRTIECVSIPQWHRGMAIGRVFYFRDITEKVQAKLRIEELSCTDMLTGLPNRRALVRHIENILGKSDLNRPEFALLHVDLDRFKQINETLGHDFGDQVLQEVGKRLSAILDGSAILARIGSDGFAMLIGDACPHVAESMAQKIQEEMVRPFSFEALNFTVCCSIGIALFPNDGENADEILSNAERAMHWCKENGRGSIRFHKPFEQVDMLARMRLDHDMRIALVERQFRLHYQPQIDLSTGNVIGAEALIRWRDKHGKDVLPGAFIPVAEETGFIVTIGEWVLQQAIEQASEWMRKGLHIPVAVNVSALQFQQPRFVERVAECLHVAGLPPRLVELELTEGILLQDAEEALSRLQDLADLGVQLSIDDFGTGYSSLAYLKRFPIHRLKIDRGFIRGLPSDTSDASIVNAIVQMGQSLQLRVIAEGVENEAQRDYLKHIGCDEFQGYLCAPALDSARFEEFIRLDGSVARLARA